MLILTVLLLASIVVSMAASVFDSMNHALSDAPGPSSDFDFVNYEDPESSESKETNLDVMMGQDYFLPTTSLSVRAPTSALNQPLLVSFTPITLAVTAIAMAVLIGHLVWVITSGFTFDSSFFQRFNKKSKDNMEEEVIVDAILKQTARNENNSTDNSTSTETPTTTSLLSTTMSTTIDGLVSSTTSSPSDSLLSTLIRPTSLPSLRTLSPSASEIGKRNQAYIWGQRDGEKWQLLKTVPQQ